MTYLDYKKGVVWQCGEVMVKGRTKEEILKEMDLNPNEFMITKIKPFQHKTPYKNPRKGFEVTVKAK